MNPATIVAISRLLLNVVLHVPMEDAELALARQTAQGLLASAGITADWHECSTLTSRCDPQRASEVISIRLLPTRVTGNPQCARLVHDATRGDVALVYVMRNRELVHDILHGPAGRSHPSLSTLETGHVTGLSIAHEVGHALNLRHARKGVMKAWIDVDDLLALRQGRLAFTPEQASQMREAMTSGSQ